MIVLLKERYVSFKMPEKAILAFNFYKGTFYGNDNKAVNIYSGLNWNELNLNEVERHMTYTRAIRGFVKASNIEKAEKVIRIKAPGFGPNENSAMWLSNSLEHDIFHCPFLFAKEKKLLCINEGVKHEASCVLEKYFLIEKFHCPNFCPLR